MKKILGLIVCLTMYQVTPAVLAQEEPARQEEPAKQEKHFPELVSVNGCTTTVENDMMRVHAPIDGGRSLVQTAQQFAPPFVVKMTAGVGAKNEEQNIRSENLRLYYNAGMVIFNWEDNNQELRVHDPGNDQQAGVPKMGRLTPDAWHEIIWEVHPHRMRLVVDGQERYSRNGDYENIKAAVGIGPAFRSVIFLKSFSVASLTETPAQK